MPPRPDLSAEERLRIVGATLAAGGGRGTVTRVAREAGVSRRFVYALLARVREAVAPRPPGRAPRLGYPAAERDALVLRVAALEGERATLEGQLALEVCDRRERRFRLLMELALAPVSAEKSARCLRAAFGASLSPSRIAALVERAGEAALAVMDRAEVRGALDEAAIDEIFSGRRPILTLIEPKSLMAVVPECVGDRRGETWHDVLVRYPSLRLAVSDQGSGLLKGVRLRGSALVHQADLFHVKRTLRRLRRKQETWCYEAIRRVDTLRALAEQPRLSWTARVRAVAEARWDEAALDERLLAFDWYETVLDYFEEQTSVYDGHRDRLRTPSHAAAAVAEIVELLAGTRGIDTRPALTTIDAVRDELFTFLRVLERRLEAVPVRWRVVAGDRRAAVEAIARAWYWRRRHQSPRSVRRYLAVLASLAYWQRRIENYDEVVEGVFDALERVVRASSAVECFNGALRPYIAVKRRLSRPFLALVAVYWNMHALPNRGGQTPFQLAGVDVGSDDWVEVIETEMARIGRP